jgi:hypothetical protein
MKRQGVSPNTPSLSRNLFPNEQAKEPPSIIGFLSAARLNKGKRQ